MYPEASANSGDVSDYTSEIVLGGGYGDFGASVTLSSETQGGADYSYITLDYSIEKYNILYGALDHDTDTSDYSHITLTYSYDDNLSFAVSKASDDGAENDPLFVVTYSVPLGK